MPESQVDSGSAGSDAPPDILRRIVETKRGEVERLRPSAGELEARARTAPRPRDLREALGREAEVGLIAEVKRRSPGAGAIRPDLDPVELARSYAEAGAAAVSVLTDEEYFGGSLADLSGVREAVPVPVLRKDFLIDPLQVVEARGAGADAVLLIARILDDDRLRELLGVTRRYGMTALVEVHDAAEVQRALSAGARVVGINNRDLSTFTTDLATTFDLLDRIPPDVVVVSESGIRSPEDVDRLGARGVDAVLVGESIVAAPDPGAHAARLSGRPRANRGR